MLQMEHVFAKPELLMHQNRIMGISKARWLKCWMKFLQASKKM